MSMVLPEGIELSTSPLPREKSSREDLVIIYNYDPKILLLQVLLQLRLTMKVAWLAGILAGVEAFHSSAGRWSTGCEAWVVFST